MRWWMSVVFCVLSWSVTWATCDWSRSGEVQKCAVTVNGQERTFLLVVPRNFSGPLVLAFHPSRAQGWLMSDRWTRKANAEGFAAIYPNAIPNARNVVAWVVERDIPFVEALLEQARKNLPSLDPRRIYAMGFSNGAWLAEMIGQRVTRIEAQCAGGKELRFYKVEGGRHRFPAFPVPPLNEPMTDSIWMFFKSHPKP